MPHIFNRLNAECGLNLLQIEMERRRYTEEMKYSSIPPTIHCYSNPHGFFGVSALTPPRLPSLIGTPQLHHIGSGISDVPSSQTTSDLSALQSSPSSSVNQSSNGFAPINNHVQMNQDNSGTACTTVTNQITYKEQNLQGHVAPMNNSNSTEPMDQDSFSGSESIAWSDTNENFVSEILDQMNNSFFLEKPQKPLVCNFPDCNKLFISLTGHTKSHSPSEKVHNLNFGHILYTICKLIQLYEVTILFLITGQK